MEIGVIEEVNSNEKNNTNLQVFLFFLEISIIFFRYDLLKGFHPKRHAYALRFLRVLSSSTKTKTSDIFFCTDFSGKAQQRPFRPRNRARAWDWPRPQNWFRYHCTCTSLLDGFHFQLVECVFKCVVDHTWH